MFFIFLYFMFLVISCVSLLCQALLQAPQARCSVDEKAEEIKKNPKAFPCTTDRCPIPTLGRRGLWQKRRCLPGNALEPASLPAPVGILPFGAVQAWRPTGNPITVVLPCLSGCSSNPAFLGICLPLSFWGPDWNVLRC